MKKNILVVVAHPDDEVLGVGGAIAVHTARGDHVSVLFMADGETSRANASKDQIPGRQKAAKEAATHLGISDLFFADFPDNQMDKVVLLDVIKVVESYLKQTKPDIIYTHHSDDLNVDHRIVFEAVMTASRPIQGNPYPKEIYTFETLSSTEWGTEKPFTPNVFIDIAAVFDKKIKALKAYENEMRAFPHPRSYEAVTALAHLRGSAVALTHAEAFMCIRKIQGA